MGSTGAHTKKLFYPNIYIYTKTVTLCIELAEFSFCIIDELQVYLCLLLKKSFFLFQVLPLPY